MVNRPLSTLIVLLVAVAVIAILVLRGNDPAMPLASTKASGPESQGVPVDSAASGLTPVPAEAMATPEVAGTPERIPRHPNGAAPALLRVKVRRSVDGSVVPRAPVRLLPEFTADCWMDERVVTTNAVGDAIFDVLPGHYTARCVYGGQVSADVRSGEAKEVEILVPAGYVVEGHVVDSGGKPIRDASIQLAFVDDMRRGVAVATTDGNGAFKLHDVSGPHTLAARHNDYAPSQLLAIQGEPGQVRTVRIRLQDVHGRLQGTVVDAQGRGIANAEITVSEDAAGGSTPAGDRRTVPAPARSHQSDPEGAFHVEGLAPVRHLLQARARGFGTCSTTVDVDAAKTSEVVLRLEKAAQVTGAARDGKGQALAGVLVWSGKRGSFGSRWTVTDASGRYQLGEVTPGKTTLTAWRSAQERATETLELAPAKTATWDPLLAAVPVVGVLRGRVVDGRNQPLVSWRVLVLDPNRKDETYWRQSDAQGSFVFTDLRPGAAVTVKVFRPNSLMSGFADAASQDVRVDGEEIELRVADTAGTWGLLRGRVTTPDGQASQARIEFLHTTQKERARADADATGGFEIKAPAGTLDLKIVQAPFPPVRRRVELQRGAILDLGTIALAQPGRILGTVVAPGGMPMPALQFALLTSDGEYGGEVVYADGTFSADALAAGDYRLAVQGDGIAATLLAFTLRAGEVRELPVKLEPGVRLRLRVVGPSDNDYGGTVSLALLDAKRHRSWYATMPLAVVAGGVVAEFEAWLAPGTYEALAWAGEFTAQVRVDVTAGAAEPLVLRLAKTKKQ